MFLTKKIEYFLVMKLKEVITDAPLAVSAKMLPYGETAHSTFQIPIKVDENST